MSKRHGRGRKQLPMDRDNRQTHGDPDRQQIVTMWDLIFQWPLADQQAFVRRLMDHWSYYDRKAFWEQQGPEPGQSSTTASLDLEVAGDVVTRLKRQRDELLRKNEALLDLITKQYKAADDHAAEAERMLRATQAELNQMLESLPTHPWPVQLLFAARDALRRAYERVYSDADSRLALPGQERFSPDQRPDAALFLVERMNGTALLNQFAGALLTLAKTVMDHPSMLCYQALCETRIHGEPQLKTLEKLHAWTHQNLPQSPTPQRLQAGMRTCRTFKASGLKQEAFCRQQPGVEVRRLRIYIQWWDLIEGKSHATPEDISQLIDEASRRFGF